MGTASNNLLVRNSILTWKWMASNNQHYPFYRYIDDHVKTREIVRATNYSHSHVFHCQGTTEYHLLPSYLVHHWRGSFFLAVWDGRVQPNWQWNPHGICNRYAKMYSLCHCINDHNMVFCLENVSKTLSVLKVSTSAKSVKIKLTKKISPCLTFEVDLVSS